MRPVCPFANKPSDSLRREEWKGGGGKTGAHGIHSHSAGIRAAAPFVFLIGSDRPSARGMAWHATRPDAHDVIADSLAISVPHPSSAATLNRFPLPPSRRVAAPSILARSSHPLHQSHSWRLFYRRGSPQHPFFRVKLPPSALAYCSRPGHCATEYMLVPKKSAPQAGPL